MKKGILQFLGNQKPGIRMDFRFSNWVSKIKDYISSKKIKDYIKY